MLAFIVLLSVSLFLLFITSILLLLASLSVRGSSSHNADSYVRYAFGFLLVASILGIVSILALVITVYVGGISGILNTTVVEDKKELESAVSSEYTLTSVLIVVNIAIFIMGILALISYTYIEVLFLEIPLAYYTVLSAGVTGLITSFFLLLTLVAYINITTRRAILIQNLKSNTINV